MSDKCQYCGGEMECTNSVDIGVGEIEFEWQCVDCGATRWIGDDQDIHWEVGPTTKGDEPYV